MAIFQMNSYKAPGSDGVQPLFYKKYWNWTSNGVTKWVEQVWQNPNIISEVNKTYICLIPKKDNPEEITDFRPVSLCNTNYKIITKIIVNKIKNYPSRIISPIQASFVPGRSIYEIILIAKEMAHQIAKAKKQKLMAIKIDLSKAHDTLERDLFMRPL